MKDNLDINGLVYKSKILNCAVSNHAGEGVMHIYDERAGMSGLGVDANLGGVECKDQKVNIVTLDDMIDRNAKIPLLKIDVEGFEWDVIQGAKRLIESHKDEITIILEWHPDEMRTKAQGDAPEKLLGFMRNLGFRAYISRFMQPLLKASDYNELLNQGADLVFTRGGHLEKLTQKNKIKNIEENNSEVDPLEKIKGEMEEKNKEIAFGRKAFYDAVAVQDQLKKKIEHPTVKDVLRTLRNFVRG